MGEKTRGTLIVIGGHENKAGDEVILGEVARRVGSGRLVVTTVASEQDDGLYEEYERVFRKLGVKHLSKLAIGDRGEARANGKVGVLEEADVVFFTGGDQLRITSQIGDTPVFRALEQIFRKGGLIAGTSAGASVLSETMLVSGNEEHSARVGDTVRMAPGLGLVQGLLIDQHFTERGRFGRLLGAVAQNPKCLGVGIDENTAMVVEGGKSFYVLGSGSVYVFDGSTVTASNIAEAEQDSSLSIYDIRLHVLSQSDNFDLRERRPAKLSGRAAEKLPEKELEPAGAGQKE